MCDSFSCVRCHPMIHMQEKIGSGRNNSRTARNWIKRLAQLPMCCDERTDILKRMMCRFKSPIKFGGSLCPRLRECHLDPAIGVDLAIRGSFDRQKADLWNSLDQGRLHRIRLDRRKATKWLEGQYEVAELFAGVVERLGH